MDWQTEMTFQNGDIISFKEGIKICYGCYDEGYIYRPIKRRDKWEIGKLKLREFCGQCMPFVDHYLSNRDQLNPQWKRILTCNQWLNKNWTPENEAEADVEFVRFINGMEKKNHYLYSITGGIVGLYLFGIPGTILGSLVGHGLSLFS